MWETIGWVVGVGVSLFLSIVTVLLGLMNLGSHNMMGGKK